jgi:IS5 family transposase
MLSDLGLHLSAKRTRMGEFLVQMNEVVPWPALTALIGPHYPKCKP